MATAAALAAAPEAVLGRRVRKHFAAGVFEGVVRSTRCLQRHGRLWLLVYSDGDREEVGPAELADVLLPERDSQGGPPPGVPRYKGVSWNRTSGRWYVQLFHAGSYTRLGSFPPDQAEAAARRYDAAARKHGGLPVNFPRPGTDELQARFVIGGAFGRGVKRERDDEEERAGDDSTHVAAAAPHAAATAQAFRGRDPPHGVPRFKGVAWDRASGRWRVQMHRGGCYYSLGAFPADAAEDAARAYDAAVRKRGGSVVNFPGSGESQAVFDGVQEAAAAADDEADAAAAQRYRGVIWEPYRSGWRAEIKERIGGTTIVGRFEAHEAEAAARAFDVAARRRGRTELNFPRPGTGETQAVFGRLSGKRARMQPQQQQQRVIAVSEDDEDAAADVAAAASPPAHRYKGVHWRAGRGMWEAVHQLPGRGKIRRSLGMFAASDAAAAARAVDAAVRRIGGLVVNFPRPGTAEVQARAIKCRAPHGVPPPPPRGAARTPAARDSHHQSDGDAEEDDDDAGGAAAAEPPWGGKAEQQAQRQPPRQQPRYKGVYWEPRTDCPGGGRWRAQVWVNNRSVFLACFAADRAEDAARCHDDAVRARGGTAVNFPAHAGETQAVFGQAARPAAAAEPVPPKRARSAAASPAPPPSPRAPPPPTDAAAFIRAVRPPLAFADAIVAEMSRNELTLAHLASLGALLADESVADAAVERTLRAVLHDCGVHAPADQAAMRCALAGLPGRLAG